MNPPFDVRPGTANAPSPPFSYLLNPLPLASAMDTNIALKNFELTNDIKEIDPQDKIFEFNEAAHRQICREEPWAKE